MRRQPFEQYMIGMGSLGLMAIGFLVTLLGWAAADAETLRAGAVLMALGVIGIVFLVMLSDAP